MMDRTFFGGMLRAAAVAAMATIVLAGCRTTKEVPGDPFAPTDGPGLVKLGPGDTMPDVTAAYARKTFYLERAANESIGWFQKPSSKQWFPFRNQGTNEEVCTHEQAAASVVAFRELLKNSSDATQFSQRFFEMFDVWQSVGYTADREVLFTGYYSPIFKASREADERFKYPLYTRPADLVSDPATGQPLGRRLADGSTQPWPSRAEIESSGMLKGTELVYVESNLDAYIIHVNGSAKLIMPDNSVMYIGYAGKTDRPYFGLGGALVEAGAIPKNQLSLSSIRRLYKTNPALIDEYILKNESYVFFTEYPTDRWPAGSLGTRVNEDASIATDKTIFPRGGLVMVDTRANTFTRGLVEYKNFMFDQDTGGAIRAAGRADLYMGNGAAAELLAGGQVANGKMYYFFLKPEFVAQYPLPEPAKAQVKALQTKPAPTKPASAAEGTKPAAATAAVGDESKESTAPRPALHGAPPGARRCVSPWCQAPDVTCQTERFGIVHAEAVADDPVTNRVRAVGSRLVPGWCLAPPGGSSGGRVRRRAMPRCACRPTRRPTCGRTPWGTPALSRMAPAPPRTRARSASHRA
ncbi:MAG: Membrane-bound lytic murein transglycosylase precursor, partial [Planctomycetota bacterium]